jgi:hypothetical protein
MTVTYGFYDSLNNDRRYNAMQFSSLLDSIIRDGVFLSIGEKFAVTPGTGLHVQVGTGRAWFDHTWTYNDYAVILNITTPHVLLDRIDTVVLETNSEQATRANSIKVITGTPSASPVPPTLTHTGSINQYPLGDVYVASTASNFSPGNITNRVGTSDTPFVTGILETIDIDFVFAQWEDDFETWFTFLQNELDSNQAANLQAQILEHDHSDPLQTLIPTGGLMDGAVSLLKLAATLRFQKLFEFAGDGVNNLDWSSIPATFTHLLLIYNGISSRLTAGSDYFWIRVNNDSAANYNTAFYMNLGPQPLAQWQYSITNPHAMGLHAGILPAQNTEYLPTGSGIVVFPNYKATTFYKSAIHFSSWNGTHSYGFGIANSFWSNTAAINRLTGNMSSTYKPRTGSLFSLYGFN